MKKIALILSLLFLFASCTSNAPTENTAAPSATPPPPESAATSEPTPEKVEVNMSELEILDNIHINQLGYRPDSPKQAVIPDNASEFSLCRADDNSIVYSGIASDSLTSEAADETVRIADFSDFTQNGEYYIYAGEGRSYSFQINENPYGGLRKAILDFFHYQKCGMELDAGVWSHPECHATTARAYDINGDLTEDWKDVTGGWHDAGDYGRYIVPAAQTVAQLLLGYEMSNNPDSELLDIVWFEIEWMLKMQDEATGGVYHKVTCRSFPPLDIMPQSETDTLYLSPMSVAATGDFAASMALASRFYPEQKDTLLAAARRAWDWLQKNPDLPSFKNPRLVVTGEYGDDTTDDERFWAACELFAATGEEKFHDYIKSDDLYAGLGWKHMGTYGLIAYLFNAGDNADPELTERMKAKLQAVCDDIMAKYSSEPYGVSLGTDYDWGSNMEVGNNAMTLLIGDMLLGNTAGYTEAALDHMNYLLGKNALSQSYITGFGSKASAWPHHRPSVTTRQTVPGMVVGGPNSRVDDDPTLKRYCDGQPPMKCYVDHIDSYASNEITIYWNSPVYFVLAVLGL
ncbi:MAG: glycoside hydrolase family 9 protein [Oscillospiraceae bacterium]|nr:glycoside hydrolase family 9 protein [Oscillospiraceae bacterium]